MKKKIFISTGEVSGDLHGSLLSKALLDEASSNNAFDNKLPCKSPETSPVLINIFFFIDLRQALVLVSP